MNFARLILIVAALSAGITTASAAVELVRVWPGYRDAASFTAAREYFGGPAAAENQVAQRTQPTERAGYYWLVRTKTPTPVVGATLRLEVTRAESTTPTIHEFTVDLAAGSHALPVGLTGTDWSDSGEVPVAWRLTLISSRGSTLVEATSFLWQNPSR